jgi:adenosylhomocysteine nucleosidase
MRLGIVTGLTAEARIARSLGDAQAGGGAPAGAERSAEALVAQGATALLSFGLAGGLDPALKPGDVIVPLAVVEHGVTYRTDPALSETIGGWFGGVLVATDAVVATATEKSALRRSTTACAVDLESGAVARVAARHGIPFAVLRAICDPAGRDLPPAALAALDRRGAIGIGRVAGSIIRRPGQIAALIRLGRDAAAARDALVRRVGRIAPRR